VDDVRLRGARLRGARRDVVLAGTEHGAVVAVDAARGAVMWRRQLGTRVIAPDCQASPDGRFGITGTMAVDRRGGSSWRSM
jgi:glucose dehydrogenase